ncbi:MAG: NHL repeat-containing protein, partial [Coriobacteriia bacterium]|nr:NHL repeat-containing protein [Coriobacteriia bacterium]
MIIADTDNSRIMILAPNGTYAGSFGTAGSGIGALYWPMGVTVDASDNIYVADTFNGRIQVFTSSGGYITETTLPLSNPRPDGICLDGAGNIYVADAGNSVVYKYASMGVGVMPTLSMVGTTNPQGISVDANGTIFVADTQNSRIAVYSANGTYVTAFGGLGSAHGQFAYPEDVVARNDGHVFVADTGNDRIEEYVYTPDVSDVTPPITTSNIPVNWHTAPFQVSLTASDTGSPISATYYSTDGNNPENLYSNPGFTVSAEGTSTIKYYSVDAKSNIETITTEQLRLDSTSPSTTTDVLAQYVGSATFKLYPSDALSGIATTWFKLNNGQATLGTDLTIGVSGMHKLEFWSEDTARNMEAVQTRWINILPVDDDPPVSSVNFDFQWKTQPTTVTISATDIVAGVSQTMYSLTKAPATPPATPTADYTGSFLVSEDGIYTLKYYSVDARGNVEPVKTATLRIDQLKPVTTSNAPASFVDSGTISLVASDNLSGVFRTEHRVDGGSWVEGTSIRLSSVGNHTVEFRSSDNAGNVEAVKLNVVQILPLDADPPISDSNIPTGWTPGPFTVSIDSQDYVSEVAAIRWSVNGGTTQSVLATTHAEFTLTEPGIYTVSYLSEDTRGNIEAVASRILKIDSQAPVSSSNNVGNYIESATIALSATDDRSGVQSIKYRLGTSSPTWTTGTSISFSTSGEYTFQFYAIDGAGNIEATHTETLTVIPPDSVPPVTTSNITGVWSKNNVTVSLTATDEVSPPCTTFYSVAGQTSVLYTGPFLVSTEGSVSVSYFSRDARNNTEATKIEYVLIDKTPPVTTTDAGTTYAGDALINLFPSDPISGANTTYYKFNDASSWSTGTAAYISNLGTHTLYYYTVDNAGNIETTKSATFYIRAKTNIYEQNNSNVVLQGPWTTVASDGSSGGSYAWTATTDARAHLYFNGERIYIYGPKGPDFGKVAVYLDGVYKTTIDLYSAGAQVDKLIWDSGDIAYQYHYVTFEYTGTKHASSSGTKVALDRVNIDGVIAQVPDTVAPV